MNGKDILSGLGNVDEKLVHEAEYKRFSKKRKLIKFIAPLAASVAVVVLSISFYFNGGLTPSIAPPDTDTPSISTPNEESPILQNINYSDYRLHLNRSEMVSASKIRIPGHFWYELTGTQTTILFPILASHQEVYATAHYSSADGAATLYEIQSTINLDEGLSGKITIASGKVINDYIIAGEKKLSDIDGVPVTAGLFVTDKNSRGEQNYIYTADFKLGDFAYYIEFTSMNKPSDDIFTSLVVDVALGGVADFSVFESPVIPQIIDESLTESEAYAEANFGKYLIKIPSGYSFNGGNRLLNQTSNHLLASWSKGYDDVRIMAYQSNEESDSRIVSPEQTELYDMSLYPIPWATSMPKNTSQIIENPVFKIEDLTLDIIKIRGYTRGESGDPSGNSLCMRFSVLYGETVVEVNSEGLSAEYLFNELIALNN